MFGIIMATLSLCSFVTLLPVLCCAEVLPKPGVLVFAHGGSPQWNETVTAAVHDAGLAYPTEIAFGMGMMPEEVTAVQEAVTRLTAAGVTEIVVVPLLVSSHSEVFRQYEYLLGLRAASPWAEHQHGVAPVQLTVPVRLGSPLQAHPCVAEILLERAQALSRDPARETVVLVAHGPNEDADNEAWLAALRELAQTVRRDGGFAAVEACMLRDDAPRLVRGRATRQLRRVVSRGTRHGDVLVVPVLMARGGIEHKIAQRLRGLRYQFSGETLLPDPRIAVWIRETVAQLVERRLLSWRRNPDMKN